MVPASLRYVRWSEALPALWLGWDPGKAGAQGPTVEGRDSARVPDRTSLGRLPGSGFDGRGPG